MWMWSGAASNQQDAEGGFVYSLGSGKLGFQLGRANDFSKLVREFNLTMANVGRAISQSPIQEGQNTVDVMYGGGSQALRWGGGLSVTRSKTATGAGDHLDSNVQAFDLRGGVNTDRWEAYGSLLLGAHSEQDQGNGETSKFDESFGVHAGGGFQIRPDLRVYAHASYDKYEASLSGAHDYTGRRIEVLAGGAYTRNLDNNTRLFVAVELDYLDNTANDSLGSALTEKATAYGLPVTLGVEGDANTWLRLRASVKQNVLLGNMKLTEGLSNGNVNYFENAPNNTLVAVGAGTSFNAFNIDVALLQALQSDNAKVEASLTYVF
jgi:hypothetical protein